MIIKNTCDILFLIASYTLSAQLALKETLYDPSIGDAGHPYGDSTTLAAIRYKFIDFKNKSESPLDTSEHKIYSVRICRGLFQKKASPKQLIKSCSGSKISPNYVISIIFAA